MIETFRNWINMLLCLGIFTTIIQLVMPKNKLRKYIYSLIGIVTIVTIISPIVNILEKNEMETALQEVISTIDKTETIKLNEEKYQNVTEETIRASFVKSLKLDIENKLVSSGVNINRCDIFIDKEYNIQKIEINIENSKDKILSVTDVVKYINQEYDIDYSKIIVYEEG